MKKLLSEMATFGLLLISILSFAQAPPKGINYQAVARDTSGKAINSSIPLNVTFSIYSQISGGSPLFTEQHNSIHTNRYGLFTLVIGSADTLAFDGINWANGNKFLEVIVNVNNHSDTMVRTQMMSVPYALFAKNSGNSMATNTATSAGVVASGGGYPGKVWKTNTAGMPAWRTDSVSSPSVWSTSGANIFNNNSGNVGIGTINPHAKLEVVDTTINLPHGIIGTEYNNNAFADSHLWLRKAKGSETSPLAIQSGDEIGFLKFRGYDGNGFSTNDQTEIGAIASENFSIGNNGSSLKFMTTPNGTSNGLERMRISQNGNVGIGTSNPGVALEIAGQVKITGGTPGPGKVLTSDNTGLASWVAVPSTTYSGGTGINISGTTINSVWTTSGSDISNNNSGKVGIGTSSPAAPLDVNGTINISGGNSSELNRTQTGAANLVPIAYGNISLSGTTNTGTNNFTSIWDNSNSYYKIHIASETYIASSYITMITVMGSNVKAQTADDGLGNLIVTIYLSDAFGTKTQNAFQFITYKP